MGRAGWGFAAPSSPCATPQGDAASWPRRHDRRESAFQGLHGSDRPAWTREAAAVVLSFPTTGRALRRSARRLAAGAAPWRKRWVLPRGGRSKFGGEGVAAICPAGKSSA